MLVRKFQIVNGPSPTSSYLQILQFFICQLLFSDFLTNCVVFHCFCHVFPYFICYFHISARVNTYMYIHIYIYISVFVCYYLYIRADGVISH